MSSRLRAGFRPSAEKSAALAEIYGGTSGMAGIVSHNVHRGHDLRVRRGR